jgi:hypothetical protein
MPLLLDYVRSRTAPGCSCLLFESSCRVKEGGTGLKESGRGEKGRWGSLDRGQAGGRPSLLQNCVCAACWLGLLPWRRAAAASLKMRCEIFSCCCCGERDGRARRDGPQQCSTDGRSSLEFSSELWSLAAPLLFGGGWPVWWWSGEITLRRDTRSLSARPTTSRMGRRSPSPPPRGGLPLLASASGFPTSDKRSSDPPRSS